MMEDEIASEFRILWNRIKSIEERLDALEHRGNSGSANTVVFDKELDRVMEKMDSIRGTYASHQSWRLEDRKRYQTLLERKKELQRLLGVKY